MTEAEILGLPEHSLSGNFEVMTDPKTGQTSYELLPARFLVNRSDVLFYTLSDGSRWQVLEDINGTKYRMKFD